MTLVEFQILGMPAPVRKKRARSASASSAAGGEEDAKSPAKKSRTTAKKKTANKRKRARSDVSESDKTIEDDSVASTSCTKATATAAAATGSSRKSLGQTRAVHRFTPIYGAISKDDQSGVSPMCYLLEFDGVNILLDCGASEKFDVSTLELLREIAPKVHLVLVSHSRLEHLGALPYAVAHLGLNAPIYSTLPVKRMGEMYFYDALIAREWGPGAEEVRAACEDTPTTVASDSMTSSKTSDIGDLSPTEQPFTVDHVDAAFERFRTLNYRQNLSVNTPGGTIVITPYPAGGGLGGALWGIKKETDLIVYANHFNHRNELHLQQCALGDPKLSKPILLITDAYNADTSVPSRNARDSRLFDETLSALRSGGNVLIPVDSGSRVLEICLAFDRHWADSRGRGAYNLALYCPLHKSMLGIAQQNMNFMSEELSDQVSLLVLSSKMKINIDKLLWILLPVAAMKQNMLTTHLRILSLQLFLLLGSQFTKDRINPFTFRYVHQCATREELDEIRGPKVVFASTNTLDYGFAHDLFGEWASNPKNLVLLTDRGSQGSLACRLACAAKNADASKPKGKKGAKKIGGGSLPSSITFVKRHHEDLEGIQLERWAAAREAERERRELERQQAAEKEEAANFRIDDGKDAADEGRASANGDLANSSVSGSADPELSSETIKDKADGSEAESKGDLELKLVPAFAMFHYKDSPSYFDDYGIQGDLTAYMDQFALADATSAISLLVEGEDGDLGEVNSKGSKKKRWKDRMTGVGKDDDLDDEDEEDEYDEYDDDDDDAIPRKLVESSITLDIKCR